METLKIQSLNEIEAEGNETLFLPALELELSEIDPDIEIDKPPTILEISGCTAMTLGNISVLIGKAKSRKTFFLTSLLAAVCSDSPVMGMEGFMGINGVLLWFDTEMSGYHLQMMVKRLVMLMGGKKPYNFKVFGLRKFSPAERLAIIEHAVYNTPNVAFVAIDGIRDLLSNGINDESEATAISSKLLKWSAEQNIHITTVLHQNKNDQNARGHVGSEVVNKSETTLSISKCPENELISVVHPDFTRDREFQDLAFEIDGEGLPVLADVPEKLTKTDRLEINIETLFNEILSMQRMKNTELVSAYMARTLKTRATALRHIARAKNLGIITIQNDNHYVLQKHVQGEF
jgi:hypothetical protein